MNTKIKPVSSAFAVLTVVALLTMAVMPIVNSSGETRLSDGEYDDERGMLIDGIVGDGHNSYAWCAEVFDGYLWVGTNRDLIGSVVWSLSDTFKDSDSQFWSYLNGMGIPFPSLPDNSDPEGDYDASGKIFRYSLDGSSGWELVWGDADDAGSEEFSGYRKMVVFQDQLYVFAGLTNAALSGDDKYIHSAVYRFGAGFDADDEPDVVLWDYIPAANGGTVTEFYRAAAVYAVDGVDVALFVGTIDGRVFVTFDGDALVPFDGILKEQLPSEDLPDNEAMGWAEIDLAGAFGLATNGNNRIWDLTVFDGRLYAFVSGNGFMVFELGLDGVDADGLSDGVWEAVVGDFAGAGYPAGLGIAEYAAASPFVMTVDGQEYVYVTTFANGPMFLISMMEEDGVWNAFDNIYCPASIYRFGADGVWEVVVGDHGDAVDSDGVPIDHVGNSRAGFFTGIGVNSSSNQYIWWMEEHDGVIYAGTWDMGFLRSYMQMMALERFFISLGEEGYEFMEAAMDLFMAFSDLVTDVGDVDYEEFTAIVSSILTDSIADIRTALDDGSTFQEIRESIIIPMGDLLAEEFAMLFDGAGDALDAFIASADAFAYVASYATDSAADAIRSTLSFLFEGSTMFGLYTLDIRNPAGFDLYYSVDGVNFHPYTVNGLGNEYNYGARVLLSTEIGLLVFTANPFGGCSVWALDDADLKTGVILPESVKLKMNVDGTDTFRIETVGLPIDSDVSVTLSDGTVAAATIVMVEEKSRPVDYWSTVDLVLGVYVERTHMADGQYYIPVYSYEVALTGLSEFADVIDVTVFIGGESHTLEAELNITGKILGNDEPGDDGNRNMIIAGAAAVVIGAVVLLYFIRKP